MDASYVFAATVRLEPATGSVEPERVDVLYRHPAPEPGTEGWLFFRDHLWRGEVNDPEGVQRTISEDLGVTVEGVELRGLETDRAYLDALKGEIAGQLELFRADDVTEVLHKYVGSRLEVREE